jgi:hypothetical protein
MKKYTQGFSQVILLVLVMIGTLAGILYYFSEFQERQDTNQAYLSSGMYRFDDVFKTDAKTLEELEAIFKTNYQENRTYDTNIHAFDYYPFQDLHRAEVRSTIVVRVEEQGGEIVSYCVVYADRPDDASNTICVDTQNPVHVPQEAHYVASFLAKLKPYKN